MTETARRERRAERAIAVALVVSAVAALGLAVTYAAGGQVQVEGVLLGLSMGSLGWALAAWGKHLLPPGPFVQQRHPMDEADPDPEPVSRLAGDGDGTDTEGLEPIGRRSVLVKLLVGAVGALGVAALFPIRSLGPNPGRSLFRTAWRKGSLVVDERGQPVRVDQLDVGGVLTVFPEGHVGAADAQTLLIRATDRDFTTRPGREGWAPEGNVAYSKVCTHAGCPVGLYQVATRELLCPCHQSLFAVMRGAKPVFGPATRSLPQLPLEVDDRGYLRSQSDYTEPIGPGFWNRP
ncbi:MAG TPA: Rieske 2Fe-2S domain-containing protein [Acidimicrobiales bacterium]|nr:Rieske 2Fe-2S domain-containing protein [Acidimicrobiales bacterium]